MFRFDVYTLSYGCPVIERGPMAGCRNFPQSKWEKINKRPLLTFAAARKLADNAGYLTVIMLNDSEVGGETSFCLYRNGKDPYVPIGWNQDPYNYPTLLQDKDIDKFQSAYNMPFRFFDL